MTQLAIDLFFTLAACVVAFCLYGSACAFADAVRYLKG